MKMWYKVVLTCTTRPLPSDSPRFASKRASETHSALIKAGTRGASWMHTTHHHTMDGHPDRPYQRKRLHAGFTRAFCSGKGNQLTNDVTHT